MSRPFEIHLPLERAYQRRVLVAVELLDAVTLARVSQDVEVVAEGLHGKPILNASGCFVWLEQDIARLRKILVKPGVLPYEPVEIPESEVKLPLTTIELQPGIDYPFAAGITGLRGTLIEERVTPPQPTEPVRNATVRLRWLDDNGLWHDAPTISHTSTTGGDFVSILRLAPNEKPDIDVDGKVTVRLRARRDGVNERTSTDFKLLQGRVTDRSTSNPLTFAWDELQP